MDKLDTFALHAMQSLIERESKLKIHYLSNRSEVVAPKKPHEIAADAYEIAFAMVRHGNNVDRGVLNKVNTSQDF
jgi:hypothetical protein